MPPFDQSIVSEYAARLAFKIDDDARNQRDNEYLRRAGPYPASHEDSAELLAALIEHWPNKTFHPVHIGRRAGLCPRSRLRAALAFMGPLRFRDAWPSAKNERDIVHWLLTVTGEEIDGMKLFRDLLVDRYCVVRVGPGVSDAPV